MQFRITRGADLSFGGVPRQELTEGGAVASVGLLGEDHPGLRPLFAVSEGDVVRAGQVLFVDRRRPEIRTVAPVAGRIAAITRGARRSLDSLVIAVDESAGEAGAEAFDVSGPVTREALVPLLLASGAWQGLRTRPFGKVPDPETVPDALFVTAMDTAPLAPDPAVAIGLFSDWFRAGVEALRHLTEGKTYICHAPGAAVPVVPGTQAARFSGPHPAGLASTHIHYLHPVGASGMVWQIGYQDVIAIGHLLETGRIWTRRVVALAGPAVADPALLLTVPGANLRELAEGRLKTQAARLLSGSPLGGRAEHYLARHDLQVSALPHHAPRPEGKGLVRRLRAFTRGGVPALIPNAAHERVAPARILPVPFLRALGIGDIETARALGALELIEEDMALLSHVEGEGADFGALLRATLNDLEATR